MLELSLPFSIFAGVLEEAEFFGITSVIEKLRTMVEVRSLCLFCFNYTHFTNLSVFFTNISVNDAFYSIFKVMSSIVVFLKNFVAEFVSYFGVAAFGKSSAQLGTKPENQMRY